MKLYIFQTFAIIFLVAFSACNNDDDESCPELDERGLVEIQMAQDELPDNIFDQSESFLYANGIGDSLEFIPGLKFDLGLDRIIKTPCTSGDSTTIIYKEQNISRSFSPSDSDYTISFSTSVNATNTSTTNAQGNLEITYYDCFSESFSISLRKGITAGSTSVSMRSNPNNCDNFIVFGQNFDVLNEVSLNGVTYPGEIWQSNDLFNTDSPYIIYVDPEIGIIGFVDEQNYAWNLIQ